MGGLSFFRLYLFFPQAQQVPPALQGVVSNGLVQSNVSPIELITLDDDPTDSLTLLTAARSALQPPSSSLNIRHRPSEATNLEPIVTSPMVRHLMELETSEQTREQSTPSASHQYAWNTSATNRVPWPLSGSSNSPVPLRTAPVMSPPIESLVREVMATCDASTIYDASTSTIFYTTTSPYRPIEEPCTSLRPHPATWPNRPYSSYQRGHDWPHQKTFSEEKIQLQAYSTQSNPKQANRGNLENPPPKPFTEQNRPSVIKSVKNKLPVLNIDPVLVNSESRSKCINGTDSTELIMKYIHKKFSRKTQCSDPTSYVCSEPMSLRSSGIVNSPSSSLSTEFDETFKLEESSQEMDNIRSSTALGDLELEGHSNIQTIFLTYLAEDVPYMEERKGVFVRAWNEVNLGEKLVKNWIAFSRDAVPLPRDFHVMAQGQMK